MINDLVSIIIPCYNSASFVSIAIESVLNQSYQNKDIILVDNNSTDNTYEILKSYQKMHPLVIKIKKELKPGAPAARNSGLTEARGKWIQFLDSDDELLPDKIEKQISLLNNREAELIIGNYIIKKTDSTINRVSDKNPWKGLISSRLGITSANLWKKAALENVGGFNEKMVFSSDEYDLMYRLMKQNIHLEFDSNFNTIINHREESVSKTLDSKRYIKTKLSGLFLRIEIRNYLEMQNSFSKEIRNSWDQYIYSNLSGQMRVDYSSFVKHFGLLKQDYYRWYYIKLLIKAIIRRFKKS